MTDLAVNTAASGNNAAAIQSLDDRVTAELASKLDSSALAPAIAPLATAAALATTDGQWPRTEPRSKACDHGSLQQGRPVGLRRAGGRGGHQEHPGRRGPEAVQLQHHGGHERLHRLGQLATVAANYGLKTVDQLSLDPAARITPLEVDTKVANAAAKPASRDASISAAGKADASALTAYALQSTVRPVGQQRAREGVASSAVMAPAVSASCAPASTCAEV